MATGVRTLGGDRAANLKRGRSASPECDVCIVGAGPYGLSAAVHLKSKGLGVRVFGEPMEFWSEKMPAGMLLRSPREASSLADPKSEFTLEAYEAASGLKPSAPVPLETFVAYGRWFRNQVGSSLDTTSVRSIRRAHSLFHVLLEDGTSLRTRRVVVAGGIGPFHRIPSVFAHLPAEQASHCYQGVNTSRFSGKRVAVIGAGQSALECAALLHEKGAQVEIIARIPALRWIGMHPRLHRLGPISRMLYSKHDVGPAGISRLVASPKLVYHIPSRLKDRIRTRAVRPAGSKWLPERLAPVAVSTSRSVQKASSVGGEVRLTLDDGTERRVDHVLLGTGYSVDISRYSFLSAELVREVRQLDGYPQLVSGFRCSVPGLHFIGATAAKSFGPLLYFVAGTEFASAELTSYICHRGANKLA